MKTLVLTNNEAKWLLKIVGATTMGDGHYSVYEKLMELKEPPSKISAPKIFADEGEKTT